MDQSFPILPAAPAPDAGVWYECAGTHGKPKVWLSFSPELVGRLQRESVNALRSVRPGGREIGGILLGTVLLRSGGEALRVEDAELIACGYGQGPAFILSPEERLRLAQAVRARRDQGQYEVLGLFRSQTRPDLRLYDEDLAVVETCFPEPAPLVVVLTPLESGLCTAGVFLRHQEGFRPQFCDLEIPLFDPSTADLVRFPNAAAAEPAADPGGAPQLAETPGPADAAAPVELFTALRPTRNWFWRLFGIAAPATVAALLVFLVVFWTPYLADWWHPAATQAPASSQPLSLQVSSQADHLLLTWDRGSAALRTAERGMLEIQDGAQRRELSLDARELTAGSVVYVPATSDIRFHLEVFLAGRGSIAESLRFVSARMGMDQAASQPAAQADAKRPGIPAGTGAPAPRRPVPPLAPANE